jgi:hypothetical protein
MRLPERETPKFPGERDRLREPKHVVVRINKGEDPNWAADFYVIPISVSDARRALER